MPKPFKLDHDRAIMLDAEALAEGGIAEAYSKLSTELRTRLGKDPEPVVEIQDVDRGEYAVQFRGKVHQICGKGVREAESWGRGTVALFEIVNAQLSEKSDARLFAINGGNDLFGMFLTEDEATRSRLSLPKKTDWPYLPALGDGWFGQHH